MCGSGVSNSGCLGKVKVKKCEWWLQLATMPTDWSKDSREWGEAQVDVLENVNIWRFTESVEQKQLIYAQEHWHWVKSTHSLWWPELPKCSHWRLIKNQCTVTKSDLYPIIISRTTDHRLGNVRKWNVFTKSNIEVRWRRENDGNNSDAGTILMMSNKMMVLEWTLQAVQ